SLLPSHIFKHHHAGKNHRSRIYFILAGILRSSTVCRFEDRVAGNVVDVTTWCDTDTTHNCRERIGNIITVKVKCRHNGILIRSQQNLLKECISDRVFDDKLVTTFFDHLPWSAIEILCAELALRKSITPVSESAFSELHDVPLVHKRQTR